MAFERKFDKINVLLDPNTDAGKVFIDLVRPAVLSGKLFMGIRVNRLDFYSGGNRFMIYEGGEFKAVPKIYGTSSEGKPMPVEKAMGNDWKERFDVLIEKCKNYNAEKSEQKERKILQKYFPHYDKSEGVIVLDREIRINDGNGKKCDWLLYNTETRQLKFVEVKMSDNGDLHHLINGNYIVINQIEEYSNQYRKNETVIIEQYRNYVDILNKLLGISLALPESFLDTDAGLAIFEQPHEHIHQDLIDSIHPFIDEHREVSLEEIWDHFTE